MEHGQRIWPAHQRRPTTHTNRFPNNEVHIPPRITKRPKINVLTLRRLRAAIQTRIKESLPHGRREPNRLSGLSQHSYSRHHHCKTHIQQCHLNTQRTPRSLCPQRLLPWHPHGVLRIHAHSSLSHTSIYNRTIHPVKICAQRARVSWYNQGHVWLASRIQNSPHAWIPPHYGAHQQMTPPPDDSNKLDRAGITRLQEVIGVFLFYGRAVDCTMLVSLCTLASQQADGTQATAKAVTQLLNYAAAHPDTAIRYIASDMYLHMHSNASYLSEAKARSRVGGTFFLSD
jgi:hypothetical protein